ncbi:hypothetical protein MKK69_02890 [Methylobacterium sp. J-026]|uniref:hypothetical protein n=1 Tax=Methylobacterium sp. J-026 TaxID=2836624 RepID=UPI001FB95710|nr:hypothetical protein [Methylobacterium sp. J-026]MCJ2133022.1 hypothetical protein [Methylobacterium sp. J-026]
MLMLITYDLNSKWSEVKQAAIANGFRDFAITTANQQFNLPNTTLLAEAQSPQDAMDRFIAIVRSVGSAIIVERAAAFDWSTGATHADGAGLSLLADMFRHDGPR